MQVRPELPGGGPAAHGYDVSDGDTGNDHVWAAGEIWTETDPLKAEAAARKAYEGDGQTSEGERRESPALSRQYADFDALLEDETFSGWCDALYRPLFEAPWRSLSSEGARS